MPPVRTPKTAPARRAGGLGAFGFTPVDKAEALARAAKSTPKAAPQTSQSSQGGSPSKPPPRCKGKKTVHFKDQDAWADEFEYLVGTSTRTISYGPTFCLAGRHIICLLAHRDICKNLWHFTMPFKAPKHGLVMSGQEQLIDSSFVRLAEACPSLKTIKIPGTCSLTDDVYIAFCKNCPDLTNLEIFAGNSYSAVDGRCFDELRENPSWAPKLEKIRMSFCDGDEYMQKNKIVEAVKALTAVREGVVVQFVNADESRDYVFGGYEVSYTEVTYEKGKLKGSKELYHFDTKRRKERFTY